jgi:hypothetical protein
MTSRDSTDDLINSVQRTTDHTADSRDEAPKDNVDDSHSEPSTDSIDDFINTAKGVNALADLLILARGLKNLTADSDNEVSADDVDDSHSEASTNDTDDLINSAKRANALADLRILARELKNLTADSDNETPADNADDSHSEASTNDTDDLINSAKEVSALANLLILLQRTDSLIDNLLKTLAGDTSYVEAIQSLLNDAPSKVTMMIHHQFPGVELISPVCAGNGIACYLSPDQCVDVDSTIQADFNIDTDQKETIGALMYKLQRKSIDQSDEVAISSEEEVTCIQFVIIWKVNSSKEFCVASFLIEHDNSYVWNEDRLLELAKRCKLSNVRDGSIKYTWLIHGNTVVRMILNVAREKECCKLETIISEGSINENTLSPRYIDLDR